MQQQTKPAVQYPKVGNKIELTVGQTDDLRYVGVWLVKEVHKDKTMIAEFVDVRVMRRKDEDLPI